MLRKEIKDAKFNNEKNLYQEFAKKLTVLRPDRSRSGLRVSNDRSPSAERKSVIDLKKSLYKERAAP